MAGPPRVVKLAWTVQEETILLFAIEKHGLESWPLVAQRLNGQRSSTECEEHFFRVYPSDPMRYSKALVSRNVRVTQAKWRPCLAIGDGLNHTMNAMPGLTTWRMPNLRYHAEEACRSFENTRIWKLDVQIKAQVGALIINARIPVWEDEGGNPC